MRKGHSVPVDLQLVATEPPSTLYHGTGARAEAAIQREGPRRMRQHHVHLSADIPTVLLVGCRHGRPAVFAVDAVAMGAKECIFYRSDNDVWLIDAVPPSYQA